MKSFDDKLTQINFQVSETSPILILATFYPRAFKPRYDVHFGLEMGIVLKGKIRRHYKNYSRIIGPGQVWFCGMWEPHGAEVIEAPYESILLIVWPPTLGQLRLAAAPGIDWLAPFTSNPFDRPQVTLSDKKALLEQAYRLTRLVKAASSAEKDQTQPNPSLPPVTRYQASTPVDNARVLVGLMNILTMVLRNYSHSGQEHIGTRPVYWDKLNRATRLVYGSRRFVSVARAAQECGLNRTIFCRLFKKWMGMNFADFAVNFRFKQSVDLLLGGDDPVKTVARQWGFTDHSHYNRIFRKYYGCSPSEFRQLRNKL